MISSRRVVSLTGRCRSKNPMFQAFYPKVPPCSIGSTSPGGPCGLGGPGGPCLMLAFSKVLLIMS